MIMDSSEVDPWEWRVECFGLHFTLNTVETRLEFEAFGVRRSNLHPMKIGTSIQDIPLSSLSKTDLLKLEEKTTNPGNEVKHL